MLFYIFFPSSLATKNLHQHIKLHLIAAFPSLFFFLNHAAGLALAKAKLLQTQKKIPKVTTNILV